MIDSTRHVTVQDLCFNPSSPPRCSLRSSLLLAIAASRTAWHTPAECLSIMPKVVKPKKPRHDPLHVELEQDNEYQKYGRVSKPGKRRAAKSDEDEAVDVRLYASNRFICR